jgi:hypothetical protein
VSHKSIYAIRQAVGQLLEYKHFIGNCRESELAILLSEGPSDEIVKYVEETLGMYLLWLNDGILDAGPATRTVFENHGIDI